MLHVLGRPFVPSINKFQNTASARIFLRGIEIKISMTTRQRAHRQSEILEHNKNVDVIGYTLESGIDLSTASLQP